MPLTGATVSMCTSYMNAGNKQTGEIIGIVYTMVEDLIRRNDMCLVVCGLRDSEQVHDGLAEIWGHGRGDKSYRISMIYEGDSMLRIYGMRL